MKKILKSVILSLLLICSFTFMGCDRFKPGTRYDLVSVTGLNGVSVDSYEYNYIKLNDDKSFYLENKTKSNGIVVTQSGDYRIRNVDEVVLTFDYGSNFLLAQGETVTCADGQFIVSAYVTGYGKVTMIFKS